MTLLVMSSLTIQNQASGKPPPNLNPGIKRRFQRIWCAAFHTILLLKASLKEMYLFACVENSSPSLPIST